MANEQPTAGVKPPAPAVPAPAKPPVLAPAKAAAVAQVKLLVDRINANGILCKAGTVIAPNVEGWPDYRVKRDVREKFAK